MVAKANQQKGGPRGLKSGLSVEDFYRKAILSLRDTARSKGIHVRFSGFNEAFKAEFPNLDPIATTNQLRDAGFIALVPRRGGPMIYLAEDAPKSQDDSAARAGSVLKKMGIAA